MHRRDGQVEVQITIEAICELIRTHPNIQGRSEMHDMVPSSVYYDDSRGIIHIVGTMTGLQSLKKKVVAEGGERKNILGVITTEDLKQKQKVYKKS